MLAWESLKTKIDLSLYYPRKLLVPVAGQTLARRCCCFYGRYRVQIASVFNWRPLKAALCGLRARRNFSPPRLSTALNHRASPKNRPAIRHTGRLSALCRNYQANIRPGLMENELLWLRLCRGDKKNRLKWEKRFEKSLEEEISCQTWAGFIIMEHNGNVYGKRRHMTWNSLNSDTFCWVWTGLGFSTFYICP